MYANKSGMLETAEKTTKKVNEESITRRNKHKEEL